MGCNYPTNIVFRSLIISLALANSEGAGEMALYAVFISVVSLSIKIILNSGVTNIYKGLKNVCAYAISTSTPYACTSPNQSAKGNRV